MNRVHVLLLSALAPIGLFSIVTHAQAPESRTDVEAIRAVIVAITDTFNQRDPKAWTRLATPDAQFVTVRGESMNGVTEIEKGLTALFQGRNRNASVKTVDVQIRLVTPM